MTKIGFKRSSSAQPQLLPVAEVEPAFGSLISVCVELQTPAGSIDNLYVTETGNLAIVECKLWRNPEARRRVVTQIIDYAHGIATWSYEKLDTAICSGARPDGEKINGGLFSFVSDNTDTNWTNRFSLTRCHETSVLGVSCSS